MFQNLRNITYFLENEDGKFSPLFKEFLLFLVELIKLGKFGAIFRSSLLDPWFIGVVYWAIFPAALIFVRELQSLKHHVHGRRLPWLSLLPVLKLPEQLKWKCCV